MSWTVSMQSSQRKGGVWGVRGGELGPHQSMQLYFHDFCLFSLAVTSIRPAGFGVICFCCESMHGSKVHFSSDNLTKNTHIHTRLLGHTLLIEARVFPPACKASSCSTYTHSFPSPPPSSHPPRLGPQGLELFSETFSHLPFHVLPVWIPLICL